ncbi:hypothetical protein SSX86_004334 [Deinandra increscens subsp. villosa]|uniref:Uncharacterized protein n=1 Tax=Deinandra increscens subsp. villosa TaxID=3103831 RepID=A0AAP0H7J1_9ASTR
MSTDSEATDIDVRSLKKTQDKGHKKLKQKDKGSKKGEKNKAGNMQAGVLRDKKEKAESSKKLKERAKKKEVVEEQVEDTEEDETEDDRKKRKSSRGSATMVKNIKPNVKSRAADDEDSEEDQFISSKKVLKKLNKKAANTDVGGDSNKKRKAVPSDGNKNHPKKAKKGAAKNKDAIVGPQWLSLSARTVPHQLHKALSLLTERQREEVASMGFGKLLRFKVAGVPGKLGHFVVDNLDTNEMVIRCPSGVIKIDEDAIHNLLEIPNSGVLVESINPRVNLEPKLARWRSFYETEYYYTNTSGGQILKSFNDDTKFEDFNWCQYIVKAIKECKGGWEKRTSNYQFCGPLTILTLLYVDAVECPGIKPRGIESSISYWTQELLQVRESAELKNGGFGKGRFTGGGEKTVIEKALNKLVDKNQNNGELKMLLDMYNSVFQDRPNCGLYSVVDEQSPVSLGHVNRLDSLLLHEKETAGNDDGPNQVTGGFTMNKSTEDIGTDNADGPKQAAGGFVMNIKTTNDIGTGNDDGPNHAAGGFVMKVKSTKDIGTGNVDIKSTEGVGSELQAEEDTPSCDEDHVIRNDKLGLESRGAGGDGEVGAQQNKTLDDFEVRDCFEQKDGSKVQYETDKNLTAEKIKNDQGDLGGVQTHASFKDAAYKIPMDEADDCIKSVLQELSLSSRKKGIQDVIQALEEVQGFQFSQGVSYDQESTKDEHVRQNTKGGQIKKVTFLEDDPSIPKFDLLSQEGSSSEDAEEDTPEEDSSCEDPSTEVDVHVRKKSSRLKVASSNLRSPWYIRPVKIDTICSREEEAMWTYLWDTSLDQKTEQKGGKDKQHEQPGDQYLDDGLDGETEHIGGNLNQEEKAGTQIR